MAGAGGVLLHDEHTGAHATDRELLMTLDPYAIDGHVLHNGAPRALAQEGDERLDRGRRPLCMHGHTAVVCVAHPAHDSELARSAPGGLSEADALDGPRHDRPDRPGAGQVIAHKDPRGFKAGPTWHKAHALRAKRPP
jgi:hypothetical protein